MAPKRKRASKARQKSTTKRQRGSNTQGPNHQATLLRLPQELRDTIWIAVLSSTRLSYGENRWRSKKLVPAPNSLSILRICKQIHEETNHLWLKHVLFNFDDGETLLDILTPLPLIILEQIRHVRVCKLFVHAYFRPVALFMLLPGLQLDTFTVLGHTADEGVSGGIIHDCVQGLIEIGNGWRELRFITADSTMLGFARNPKVYAAVVGKYLCDRYTRRPQPAGWLGKLAQRDTRDTGASITIYRSTLSDSIGSVSNPSTREIIHQEVRSPETLDPFGITEDKIFTEEKKELLVIVKRGRQADIATPIGPRVPKNSDDLRGWATDMPWNEMSRWFCANFFREPIPVQRDAVEDLVEIDTYTNVDDFTAYNSGYW